MPKAQQRKKGAAKVRNSIRPNRKDKRERQKARTYKNKQRKYSRAIQELSAWLRFNLMRIEKTQGNPLKPHEARERFPHQYHQLAVLTKAQEKHFQSRYGA